MESQPGTGRKRRKKLYRIGKKKTFFDRKSKRLNMTYRDVSIFLTLLLFILIGLFNRVIINFIYSYL